MYHRLRRERCACAESIVAPERLLSRSHVSGSSAFKLIGRTRRNTTRCLVTALALAMLGLVACSHLPDFHRRGRSLQRTAPVEAPTSCAAFRRKTQPIFAAGRINHCLAIHSAVKEPPQEHGCHAAAEVKIIFWARS